MGTYTTNYQLYTPTVGETGWGTLVNGNFTIIDSTMKSLSNRITAVENEVNGNLSCTSVTASGKITGNGGIAGTTGTFSGAVTGTTFNGIRFGNSLTYTVTPTSSYFSTTETRAFTYISPMFGARFSGRLAFRQNPTGGSDYEVYLTYPSVSGRITLTVPRSGAVVYANFTNVLGVTIENQYPNNIQISGYTIT